MNHKTLTLFYVGSSQDRHQKAIQQLSNDNNFRLNDNLYHCLDDVVDAVHYYVQPIILIDLHGASRIDFYKIQNFIQRTRLLLIALIDEQQSTYSCEQLLDSGFSDCMDLDNLKPYMIERCLYFNREKQALYQQLEQRSHIDSLTGLPNLIMFKERLGVLSSQAQVHNQKLSLIIINIDNFNKINEDYGFDIGDAFIQATAARLRHRVKQSETLARQGGDEFAIILRDYNSTQIQQLGEDIVTLLSSPVTVDNHTIRADISIGTANMPSNQSLDTLLKHARHALMEAKKIDGSHVQQYNCKTSSLGIKRHKFRHELNRALRDNQFELNYQPKVDVESNEIVSVECLVRWPHKQYGYISPAEFIPEAEATGLIVPLGYWIIRQACRDMQAYSNAGNKPIDFAVNLSFKQLQDRMFVATVKRIIEETGIDPCRLEFELTETAIMSNYDHTYESMMALNKLGITFSLDDFGTGYSSFSHLQQLPISALKIDRSFVTKILENNDDAMIVKAMISLAHSLRLIVVAEGVETEQQLTFLKDELCDMVQGYYYSPAINYTELNNYIHIYNSPERAKLINLFDK